MAKGILQLINTKYDSLTKKFKLVADFIRSNYTVVPFLTINELGARIGVSNATITRFSQEMGFEGYSALQKKIQGIVEEEILFMREVKYSITSKGIDDDEKNTLQRMIDLNTATLQQTYSEKLQQGFKDAVELIAGSRKIYILGSRSSFTPAYYLYYMLGQFMGDVELISMGTGDAYNRLAFIKDDDLLIAFNFAQCTKFTATVTEHFRERGNKIIAVTDSYSSPIAKKAHVVLIAKNSPATYSFVSAMTILNAIVVELGILNERETLEQLKLQQRIALEKDVYVN